MTAEHFAELDVDNNGELSKAELPRPSRRGGGPEGERGDRRGDGPRGERRGGPGEGHGPQRGGPPPAN
jgi:hypothetical protein